MHQLLWDAYNPYTGQKYTFGDKNLIFGPDGLGYARDAWDEGFVPYVIPPHPSSTSTRQADQPPGGPNSGSDMLSRCMASWSKKLEFTGR